MKPLKELHAELCQKLGDDEAIRRLRCFYDLQMSEWFKCWSEFDTYSDFKAYYSSIDPKCQYDYWVNCVPINVKRLNSKYILAKHERDDYTIRRINTEFQGLKIERGKK